MVGFNAEIAPWPYDPDKARELVAEAKADGVPVDRQIRLIGRNSQFPGVTETVEVMQSELANAGLNVKIEMMDTAAQLQYQLRPFPDNAGPFLALIQHGNQAGDAAFSVDQYMSVDGAQSSSGTPAFDEKIKAAGKLIGEERQKAYEQIFADEPNEIAAMAYIAHMRGILGKSARVDYTPNPATGDEMLLAAMTPASSDRTDQS